MEYIKKLKKQYYEALKLYYGSGSIIFKMNFNRRKYDALVEADWAFRTCMVGEFRNIAEVYAKDQKKAVKLLQARARGFWYTASVINSMLDYPAHNSEQREALKQLTLIKEKLLEIAKQDEKVSNYWALRSKMPKLVLEPLGNKGQKQELNK